MKGSMKAFEIIARLKDYKPNTPVMVCSDKHKGSICEVKKMETMDLPVAKGCSEYIRVVTLKH